MAQAVNKLNLDHLPKTLQGLLDDPSILKVMNSSAQTRQLSVRKDYAFRIDTVDKAIEAARKYYGTPRDSSCSPN